MTTQEAKEILDDFNKMRRWLIDKTPYSEQIREAINVAIETLKEADNDFFAKAPIKKTIKCKAKIIKTNSMATKFMALNSKKGGKKTVFKTCLAPNLMAVPASGSPCMYDNVLFVGNDKNYGDVFKAWDKGDDNSFTLYFGEKGDEFND